MRTALIRCAAIATVVVASVALFASPSYADARSVPSGDALYALTCDPNMDSGQLVSVDSATGDSTNIGNGTAGTSGCALEGAWDAASQTAYWQDEDALTSVYSVNLTTGASSLAFTPNIDGTSALIDSLAITPAGVAYAVNYAGDTLYSISLTTGAMTEIGLLGDGDPEGYYIAADPRSGVLYGFGLDSNNLDQIDVSTGAATPLATDLQLPTGQAAQSIQVDSAGIIWIVDGITGSRSLISVDPGASDIQDSITLSGTFTDQSEDYLAGALIDAPAPATTVVPTKPAGPTLATTGVNAGPAGALGGGLLILGILALAAPVLLRRQRARA